MLRNCSIVPICVSVLCCLVGFSSFGLYVQPELEIVPIDRLAENLKAHIKHAPEDPVLRLNLARLYAMRFALKIDEVEIVAERPDRGPWFGPEPSYIPFTVKPAKDETQQKAAEAHLREALAEYERLLWLEPGNLAGRLGYGWCLEQAGLTKDAIREYRRAIKDGWAVERKRDHGGLGFRSIVGEAGGYLIPLLDAKKDANEIQQIKKRTETIYGQPRFVTPIIVPLRDGSNVASLEDRRAKVLFDADGSGRVGAWTWITADAAWLVSDPHGRGTITSALQLFGNVTWWLFWDNGYKALSALDNDGDGELAGSELDGLALWRDVNGNGVSERGEVLPLALHGIVSLSCRSEMLLDHPDRIAHSPHGVTFRDGTTRPTYDVILRSVK